MSKILVIDIETRPTKAYVWRLFKENVGLDQIIEPGGISCFGAKWVGEREVFFYSDWEHGHQAMLEAAHALLSDADAVVTYNGDRFDIPKLTGEFLLAGLPPPPPVTSIDLFKTVKYKLGLLSNRLAFVGDFLKVGSKIKTEGFTLWSGIEEGKEISQKRMKRYCCQDVRLTEKVYKKIAPYIRNHPYMSKTKGQHCGYCESTKLQSRGERRTKSFLIQRIQCQDCGSWQDGKRTKVA